VGTRDLGLSNLDNRITFCLILVPRWTLPRVSRALFIMPKLKLGRFGGPHADYYQLAQQPANRKCFLCRKLIRISSIERAGCNPATIPS
jgi:hypothetical protein